MWKSIAVMLLLTVGIGVGSTIWYGTQVKIALDKIGRYKAINHELIDEKKLLLAQRDLLLSREHMKEAAQKIGLVTPAKGQLRYP
ncbi:MAG: hypothetical protein R3297_09075 [Desulfobulbales bacterium]|nr:hypothetical protein [Desulfobulbales bacterium]